MQTFLPYPDFVDSAKVLDVRRLGKQRVEASQIIDILLGRPAKNNRPRRGWLNHPAVKMWRGFENSLKLYHNVVISEWIIRGYRNNMPFENIEGPIVDPFWLGDVVFHRAHRSQLLFKNNAHYSQFNWIEKPGQFAYYWPVR